MARTPLQVRCGRSINRFVEHHSASTVDVPVEIGRTHMTIRETLALGPGSIEVVVIEEDFGCA